MIKNRQVFFVLIIEQAHNFMPWILVFTAVLWP